MNNNKENSLEWYIVKRHDLEINSRLGEIEPVQYGEELLKLEHQAREMYRDEIEAASIISSAEQSTSAASQNTEAFAIGYDQGYKRAVDYMKETLKNKIEIKKNGSNISTTVNTTGTTFLCTEFVSDQLFYKGTLPHCMRCGKPQYQHPIISNTI